MEDSFAHTAAAAREQLLTTDLLGHRWRDRVLQPWTQCREALLLALIKADTPAADTAEIDLLEKVLTRRRSELLQDDTLAAAERARLEHLTLADMVADSGFSWMPYFATAAKCLWLASHQPDDWQHLRGPDVRPWLTAIDLWAEASIAPHEIEAAARLTHQFRTAHRALMVLPRPASSSSAVRPGN